MIVGRRGLLQRDAQERTEVAWERMRKQRVAFDHAGIAVGRLLPGVAAIEQGNAQPALGEVQGNGGADHAGAEHDRVGTCHLASFSTQAIRRPNGCRLLVVGVDML